MPKRIAILGSTGSIGTQALEVIRDHPADFEVEVLSACQNYKLLIQQAQEFNPNAVVISKEEHYPEVAGALQKEGIKVFTGDQSLIDLMEMETIDLVLIALVGFAGLLPTLKALESGRNIALANKETLVVAGNLVTRLVKEKGVALYPVDSEHSAIFQCLAGEFLNPPEKIILTASGGPFRGWGKQELQKASLNEALAHPNWKMGSKVTIDSASLMNKGLEVIEARWLFGLSAGQIEVVIHPQSIIHSMVQFSDGSIKAQLGLPDMRLPILYALSYPKRFQTTFPRLSFTEYSTLTFEPPDRQNFPCLDLAYATLEQGGNAPCVLNAANEMAVQGFLRGKLGFVQIPGMIEQMLQQIPFIKDPSLDDLIQSDQMTREISKQLMSS